MLLPDCHSFPSALPPFEPDQVTNHPDTCIVTDKFHTPPDLVEIVQCAVSDEGFYCCINIPFGGCLVPNRFLEQDKRVPSIVFEVNRSLYMDERNG